MAVAKSDFVRGRDWDIALWAGPKTPLSGTMQARKQPQQTTSASPNDMVICEILETPKGLLAALSSQKAHASFDSSAIKEADPQTSADAASFFFGITELMVVTPGNFASAELYAPFAGFMRKKYPGRGILVVGHAGIQADDRNGRVRLHLEDYVNLNAHFYANVALTEHAARVLTPPSSVAVAQAEDGGESSDNRGQRAHHRKIIKPRLIAAAHSVGAYILCRALDQVTQRPHWEDNLALAQCLMYAPILQKFEAAPAGSGTRALISPVMSGVIAYGAVLPFWLLPDGLKSGILEKVTGSNEQFAAMLTHVIRPSAVWNCLGLVRDAYDVILDLDGPTGCGPLLAALQSKLHVYFCFHDDWVPPQYIATLKEKVGSKLFVFQDDEKHKDVAHSCCVTHPERSAEIF